jgi:hypothetical protein
LIILFSVCGLNSYGAMEYEREESIGYITGEQAALQFFQKGVTAAFSIGFDGLMDGVVGSFKGFGILAEGLENLGKSIIKNNFNSWVNAFELDGKGGWDWNGEAYQESAWGSGALGMYASAFVTPMAQRGATDFFTQDGTGLDLAENVFGVENLKALGSTLGSLTGEFASYLFDGEFSVNVLDMSDLTGGAVKQGLFELSFTGKSRIGGGGANLGGLTGILNSLEAIKTDALYVASRKLGGHQGLAEINATNRLGYSGMEFNIDLARSIVSGETKVAFENLNGAEGAFDLNRPNTLLLDKSYLGNGAESASKAASILSHEGGHAAYLSDRESGLLGFRTYGNLALKGMAEDMSFLLGHYSQIFEQSESDNGYQQMKIKNLPVRALNGAIGQGFFRQETIPYGVSEVQTTTEKLFESWEFFGSLAVGAMSGGSGTVAKLFKALEFGMDFVSAAENLGEGDYIGLAITLLPWANEIYSKFGSPVLKNMLMNHKAKNLADSIASGLSFVEEADGTLRVSDGDLKRLLDSNIPGKELDTLLSNPTTENALRYLQFEDHFLKNAANQMVESLDFLSEIRRLGDFDTQGLRTFKNTEAQELFAQFINRKYNGNKFYPIFSDEKVVYGINANIPQAFSLAEKFTGAAMANDYKDFVKMTFAQFDKDTVVESLIIGMESTKLMDDLNDQLKTLEAMSDLIKKPEFFVGFKSSVEYLSKGVLHSTMNHILDLEYANTLTAGFASLNQWEKKRFISDVEVDFQGRFAHAVEYGELKTNLDFRKFLNESNTRIDLEWMESIVLESFQNMYDSNGQEAVVRSSPRQEFDDDLSNNRIRRANYQFRGLNEDLLKDTMEVYKQFLISKGEYKYGYVSFY